MEMGMRIGLHILGTLALALSSCSSETVSPPPKPPVGSLEPLKDQDAGANLVTAKERALPDLYAAAIGSAGPGAPFGQLGPLLDPDLVEFSFPGMLIAHERAGVVAAHEKLFGAFDDRKMVISRVWRTSNEQTIEWVMTGTQTREWNGIAPTRKSVAFKGATLMWTKDDGSITNMHPYFDVALIKAQLTGAGPKELLALPPPSIPTEAHQVFEQTGEEKENTQVDFVKAWLAAIDDNKEAEYSRAVTDDVEVYTLESGVALKGREERRKYFRAAHRAIGQLDTIVSAAWGVGSYVIIEYDIDGDQLAPFSWIPALASSKPKSTRLAHFDVLDICEIQGGKISRVWRYDNPTQSN
jgi:hypothetical protein